MNFCEKTMEDMRNSFSGNEWPWDMCNNMMSGMSRASVIDTNAPPEIKRLFDEWLAQIEEEILDYIKESGSIDTGKIAEHFKLSKESIIYMLTGLAKKGKVNFKKEA